MSKVHTYSKHGVWRVCKGRRCALCRPVLPEKPYMLKIAEMCAKSVGLGHHRGVGKCVLIKGHSGDHHSGLVGAL